METYVLSPTDEEIRNRIINAAREAFLTFGFSRVTVDEIANNLGMSKKTLYKFFPGKEDLLREVTRHEIRTSERACRVVMEAPDGDFIQKLRQIMSVIAMQYAKIRPPLIEDLKKSAPHVWKEIAEHRSTIIRRDFAYLLQEGVKAGVFRSDVNMDIVLTMYAICTEKMINPDALSESAYSATQVFETIIAVILDGIFTEDGRNKYKMQPAV